MLIKISIYRNQFKCGAFFENLTAGRELTWVAALPEALKKAEDKKINIKEVFGEDIKKENFNMPSCSNITANARCYTYVTNNDTFKTKSFLCCPFR